MSIIHGPLYLAIGCLGLGAAGTETPNKAAESALPTANLVVNGDFTQGVKGWPVGAFKRPGIAIRHEAGQAWLAIGSNGGLTQNIRLDPQWAALRVRTRMRVIGVVPGKLGWHDARLAMSFADAQGKHLDPWPNVFHAQGTTAWQDYDRVFKIPAGAARLDLAPSMFGSAGTAEFANIVVTVVRLRSGMAEDLPLPAGAADLGNEAGAWRETSGTRESICLNGLWRFLPAGTQPSDAPPAPRRGWGWFKVPGIWPSSVEDAQRILLPDEPNDAELRSLDRAWYQRPLTVPGSWVGRKILLDFTMLQTHARVWIDGQAAGEVFFPGGWLDVSTHVKPGAAHVLSVLVTARPLEKDANVFMAPERIITNKAVIRCKGLTGDVWLRSQPTGETIADVHVITSTRQGTIAFDARIDQPGPGKRVLEARVYEGSRLVKTFQGDAVVQQGRATLVAPWPDAKRWDLHTPQNLYTAVVTLHDAGGTTLDQTLPIRFGFREFWTEGRDFYLNGSRIHLRLLTTANIYSSADVASLDGCRTTCRWLKEYGFNALVPLNYSFAPGDVGYMDGVFDATDEEGLLATFSLPHIKDFNMKLDNPQQAQRYRSLCEWLIRRAQNHPSIVMYSMNHNSTGYFGDQNPQWIDGLFSPDAEWARTNSRRLRVRTQATLAAAIAQELDATRPVYHHQSGNLGALHTVNIYLNWAPLQERSDWLEHWAAVGVKPVFFVEWGLPHVSSWSSFRGPEFIWRFPAFQQIWDSEFAAPYLGQQAYRMTPTKVQSLDWEEELWARGKPFYWSELIRYFRTQDENYTQVQALYAADNWRSHRTWGISAMLPWDQENMWRTPPATNQRRPVDQPYAGIRRPGIVADAVAAVGSQAIYCRDMSQVRPSELGRTFLRWNKPLCAYVSGDARHFTEKGHNFVPGETVGKQLVMLNDTREAVRCHYTWKFSGGAQGEGVVAIAAGDKATVPLAIALPHTMAPGRSVLAASFDFGAGQPQEDSLAIDVLPPPSPPSSLACRARVALFDPAGETGRMLRESGVKYRSVDASDALDGVDLLVIGRKALANGTGPVPGWNRVAGGLKMLVFEQDADALEKKFGFRVNVHGLRQVFTRAPSHPILAGLSDGLLHDWRGSATSVPPYLDIPQIEDHDPRWT